MILYTQSEYVLNEIIQLGNSALEIPQSDDIVNFSILSSMSLPFDGHSVGIFFMRMDFSTVCIVQLLCLDTTDTCTYFACKLSFHQCPFRIKSKHRCLY